MNLQQLHYVIAIADTGSVNRAAEELYVAQPSITRAVQELERELDITIFNRTSKGMTLTQEGMKFLPYAREVWTQYSALMEEYGKMPRRKTSFAVSTQHYSFAVKAFVEMTRHIDVSEYELAIRETRTQEVISDVASLRSEIGVLYLNEFNRKALMKLLNAERLTYHHLADCGVYVYLWRSHPLAGLPSIRFEDLLPYPCLSFEQGSSNLFFSEELLSTKEYPRLIRCCDRATVLNLMVGLYGYTICSGIICEEYSGEEFIAVPFAAGEDRTDATMEIGWIERKNSQRTTLGVRYIEELERYLGEARGI